MYGNKLREKTVAQQVASIKAKYPRFTVKFVSGALRAEGQLQPTARSDKYTIAIYYTFKKSPIVKVLAPELVSNFKNEPIPHIYSGKHLCLYMPKYKEFKYSDLISDTIIPWTSLWLYYYEVWHVTGDWEGGGEHPN